MVSHDFADSLPDLCSPATGEPQPDPRLVQLNEPLAKERGLDPDWLRSAEGLEFLLGHDTAHAMAYSGFQFGQFNPHMGDGRALLLGEVEADGRLWDLHAKGTGPTPYSRPGSDGRGTLRSMLREYLYSEALHALGVPTTRSLAVISTGRQIARQRVEPAGVVVRVAESHLRVGTFHLAALNGGLEELANYARRRHYPDASDAKELFYEVMRRQANTVAAWQVIGFIHGVMNTDNTTISGQTIDFGPCAFMESYDPDTWFSSIDRQGRYRFGHQPNALGWNLTRLAESMLPLFADSPDDSVAFAQEAVNSFGEIFGAAHRAQLHRRLDIPPELAPAYQDVVDRRRPDLTLFHRALADAAAGDKVGIGKLAPQEQFVDDYLATDPQPSLAPYVIPRARNVEAALEDPDEFVSLLRAVTDPFNPHPEYAAPGDLEGYVTYCGT